MNCETCGNKSDREYYHVCENCYSQTENLPTRVMSSAWVTVVRSRDGDVQIPHDEQLRRFVLESFESNKIIPYSAREVVVINGKMEIPVRDEAIDKLAKETGLVIGKWLLYVSTAQIDEVWKKIASSTFNGKLGVDTKVSTPIQAASSGKYVICVYTKNCLDLNDVNRVRERLRQLGFVARLYYKPDIYTYLNIYKKTFPNIKASRYSG